MNDAIELEISLKSMKFLFYRDLKKVLLDAIKLAVNLKKQITLKVKIQNNIPGTERLIKNHRKGL